MQRLALKRAYHKRSRETFANAGSLRQVKVAAATLGNCEPLLADIDHVKEVRTGTGDGSVSDSSEIGDWNYFDRRFLEKQEANRRVRSLREVLDLFERRLDSAFLPRRKFRKAMREIVNLKARTLTSPVQ